MRELVPGSQYEIPLMISSNLTIFLSILLPPSFPNGPPVFVVKPHVRHAWINAQGYLVGHDKLSNWSQHASLGKIVKDINIEFSIRPPIRDPSSYKE